MLYYLFEWLDASYNFPGAGLFQYSSFRAAMAVLSALLIGLFFGKKIINFLRRKQMGEIVRDLGLAGQVEKTGTPTMGGLIIILSTVVPVLLFAKLNNIYIITLLISTIWMGGIGFLDDYLKYYKKDKRGLAGKFKVLAQVGLGIIVGAILYFSPEVTINQEYIIDGASRIMTEETKSLQTNLPFIQHNSFDYSHLLFWLSPEQAYKWAWIVFIPVVVFIVTAVSNGANLTDGIDGLAGGSSAIIVAALAVFSFVSGNIIFADYLNIFFIPRSEEILIFCSAFIGGLIGFLWYNTYPAQIFMGDTGSLCIGGIIAVIAIALRKELLLPLLCGIFLAESLSVMMQVSYFKYTKKKFGEGRRIFLMSPLHHHYQKKGYHESKIVNRMLIVGFILAIVAVITLKVR